MIARFLDFIASFANALRVGTYGPQWDERPSIDGQAAWEAFQDDYRLREEAERVKHGKVNAVRAEKQALVHASLALAVPTARVADGCSRSEAVG